jgi:hypothetical protein
MFKDNWLLGIGVGNQNFREIYGLYMKTGFDALSAYNIYLETAVESADDYLIGRALNTINGLLADVAKTKEGDVTKIKNADGGYVYINYTSGNVIVQIDATRFELISAQSYLVIEPTTK